MKTQIITLESHDDLVSVRDRMSWAKSPRILLVWPRFERITLRPVDLRILQHHAADLGADLGLVTRSGRIWREAKGFGIPVFRSTAKAQHEVWGTRSVPRQGRRRGELRTRDDLLSLKAESRRDGAAWTAKPVPRFGFFLMGVLAALALAAAFVPRATVVLSPATRTQQLSLPVEAGLGTPSSVAAMSLPAQASTVTITGTQSVKITSRGSVPRDKARGIARFQNLTLTPLVIPAGTVVYGVSPAGVRYATMNETSLEGKPNAFVEVPVQALDAGEAGNAAANTIEGIEGSLALSASVTNPSPVTGGSDQNALVASPADRDLLRTKLLGELQGRAMKMLKDSISGDDLFLEDTVKMVGEQSATYDPTLGQPGATLTLTISAEYAAEFVSADDIERFAEASLNASMPAGFRPAPEALDVQVEKAPELGKSGKSSFTLNVRRLLLRTVDLSHANAIVRGLSPGAAADRLQAALPLSRRPEVQLSPEWWPWLPLIPFRIGVVAP